jgi:Beige/BEACH domain
MLNQNVSTLSGGSPKKADEHADASSSYDWLTMLWKDLLCSEYAYHCMPLTSVYTIYKKRYELKLQALEITDVTGYSVIFSCHGGDRADKVIKILLQNEMPNSLFSRIGPVNLLSMFRGFAGNFYNTFLNYLLTQLTKMWQNNELTNFAYLMHLNAASGRSYHDLTQYPGTYLFLVLWFVCITLVYST